MTLSTDTLIDRNRLKAQVMRWRGLAILIGVVLAFVFLGSPTGVIPLRDYIARIKVEGFIDAAPYRQKRLAEIAKDNDVSAVILHINSPGGTVVGGESLQEAILEISKNKPVVVVMGSLATSAAYMTAIAADHIIARKGTITGSIGVLVQTAQVVKMAEKLGVEFDAIKSSPLKGTPSPLENTTPEARQAMAKVVNDFYNIFIDMVAEHRNLEKDAVKKLADGRIFIGQEAMDLKLVDAVGSEKDALKWLEEEKDIKLKVKDVPLKKKEGEFGNFVSSLVLGDNTLIPKSFLHQGLLSIWVGDMMWSQE